MTQQLINIGLLPNDQSGDPLRTAFTKINQNFTNLYAISNTFDANGSIAIGSVLTHNTGSNDIAIGVDSLYSNTTGSNNIGIGQYAGQLITTGSNNTIIGSLSGAVDLADTVLIGAGTTERIKVDASGLYINGSVFKNIISLDSYQSFFIGNGGSYNTGVNNFATGLGALYANTTGSNDIAIGVDSLYSNTTGSNNVGIGQYAGQLITTGSNNTIIGSLSGAVDLADTVLIGAGTTERIKVDASGLYINGDVFPNVSNIPTDGHFYVNAERIDAYNETGTILYPFKTIGAALAAVELAVANGTVTVSDSHPAYILVQTSVTENITLTRGHVFITGYMANVDTPVFINGTITVNGANSSVNAYDINHFGISGIEIAAAPQQACIYFTGTNAQQVWLNGVWLKASGDQNGASPLVDAGGYGIYADNTGVRLSDGQVSTIDGTNLRLQHIGIGGTHCIELRSCITNLRVVQTSSAYQIAAVYSAAVLIISLSELTVIGASVIESYGTGVIQITRTDITNKNDSVHTNGIYIHDTTGTVILDKCTFSVANLDATSKAVAGQGQLIYSNIIFGRDPRHPLIYTNNTIDSAITLLTLPSDFTVV